MTLHISPARVGGVILRPDAGSAIFDPQESLSLRSPHPAHEEGRPCSSGGLPA